MQNAFEMCLIFGKIRTKSNLLLIFQIKHLVDSRHGTSILRAFEPIGDLPIRWDNQELMSFKLDKGLLFGII